METLRLGQSDLTVSRIGHGGCPLGGHGWGDDSEKDLTEALQASFGEGINLFDTADVYGLGVSEKRLGKVFKDRRSQVTLCSKFGVRIENGKTFYDNSPEWMERALNASLVRLQTDYIDLYQLHYWDETTSFETIFETLERFRDQGKIRYYGVTNVTRKQLTGIDSLPAALVSCSFEYSLLQQKNKAVIQELMNECSVGFISWGSLSQGLLGGRFDGNTVIPKNDRRCRPIYVNFHGDRFQANLGFLEHMRKHFPAAPSLAQLSLRWILDRVPHSVALVGMKNKAQAKDNAATLTWKLTGEECEWLTDHSSALAAGT